MNEDRIIEKINMNQFMIDDESKHLVVPGEPIISQEDYMKYFIYDYLVVMVPIKQIGRAHV